MSRPQIWHIEQEKDKEKEKVGGRPAKVSKKKGDRDLEREIRKRVYKTKEYINSFLSRMYFVECSTQLIEEHQL